jgi:hypothetical protein
MLQRRRVEGRIIEDIEGRLRLRGAGVDIPRYMVGKGVRSIKCYPAPYREEPKPCQTGIPAIKACWELHC